MRRFERGDETLVAREQACGFERLCVGDGTILGAAELAKQRVLRSDRSVIETSRDGMGERDLAITVLKHVAIRTVQHAGAATGESRGVVSELCAAASGFDADQAN